jgi:hypothetical protein
MKTSTNLSGDRLIQDYLHRLSQAALRLPKGTRMAFVGRVRARIERERATADFTDPAQVTAALATIGEPEDLVRQERGRIDEAWLKRRAKHRYRMEAAEAARAAATPPQGNWVLRAGRQPSPDTMPLPASPPADVQPPGPSGDLAGAGSQSPDKVTVLAQASGKLAFGHLLESFVIALIALGGLVFPILPPVWLLGSVFAMVSRVWDVRDKWVAVAGPLLVTVLGSALIALIVRGPGNVAVIYIRAIGASGGYLIRLGCLLSATYLGWRVHRGPREKVPPWRRE